ncbi:MAG: hypothetical protein ABI609_16545 [Acidobacteriota bacterium]
MGGMVALVISTLTLGGQAVFLRLVKSDVSEASADTLFQVFVQTAPLTIAVAIVGLAIIRKWVDGFLKVVLLSAWVLFASLQLGSRLGRMGKLPTLGNGVLSVVFGATAFYWKIYGPSLFVSALVLGGFLAWVVNKVWPESKAAKLVRD